ncbi:hypothetical protein VSX64_14510 [Aurantimonas sp. C2-6-R+9]|uniref:hypothetical protein n=1 Tax=unclassified Aurantimonas TaxID=2638230 RepID=UPI002E19424A|nr:MULTISPECIES: hypothetical protein [unclassified Aurantimonas]MEC5291968.1 hypothetical protein [Aurantimonas sp. C2-3-R2]MEC5382080.1 hypothetical protein [Aurantimonas sp. C2-6-R+9]
MRCSYCGSNGHTYANCPETFGGSSRRANMRCTYCGGRNHKIEACPKTFGGSAARAFRPEDVADHFIKDRGRP